MANHMYKCTYVYVYAVVIIVKLKSVNGEEKVFVKFCAHQLILLYNTEKKLMVALNYTKMVSSNSSNTHNLVK